MGKEKTRSGNPTTWAPPLSFSTNEVSVAAMARLIIIVDEDDTWELVTGNWKTAGWLVRHKIGGYSYHRFQYHHIHPSEKLILKYNMFQTLNDL